MILILVFVSQPSREFPGWQRKVCVSISFWWVYSRMFVAEFREDLRIAIPAIAKRLKDSHPGFRLGAINLLSRLGAQGMC